MFKLLIFVSIFAGIQARFFSKREYFLHPQYNLEDPELTDKEDLLSELPFESVQPGYLVRNRRQITEHTDGSKDLKLKVPLAGDGSGLSAVGGLNGWRNDKQNYDVATGGLMLERGQNQFSATASHLPGHNGGPPTNIYRGDANVNVYHDNKQDVFANAFATKSNNPFVPNYGGGLGYKTSDDRFGASVNAARTDFLKKTDVSALGNINLYKDPTTSLGYTAGVQRSFSPYIPKSSWEPQFGFILKKTF